MNVADRTVARIDAVLTKLDPRSEDARVLKYARSQLTPDGQAARPKDEKDVAHLQQVAEGRLRRLDA